jgi:hypothetical protein
MIRTSHFHEPASSKRNKNRPSQTRNMIMVSHGPMMSRREVKAVLLYWLLQYHHRDSSGFVVHGFALHRPRSSALAYRNHETTTAADQEGRRILSPVLSPSTPAVALKNKRARANTRRQQLLPQKYIVQKQERHDGTTKSWSTTLLGPVGPDSPAQQRNEESDKYYWNVLGQEVARAMMVVALAALVWPVSSMFSLTADFLSPTTLVQEVLAAIATAVPLIFLLPVSHGAWRIRQDAVVRLYGTGRDEADNDQQAKYNVLIAMAPMALARAVQEEVFFRLLLCGVVGAMNGSPWFALGLGSLVYGSMSLSLRRRLDEPTIRLDHWLEGLWYSGLFVTGTVGIPGLILAHGLVHWHEDATCWQHVVTQLRYVEAQTTAAGLEYDAVTDAAATATTTRGAAHNASPSSSSTSDLYRFFLAHDSRHCGKLHAHDMRRALEYTSSGRNNGRISRRLLESVELNEEYDYDSFEAKLRALHKEGVLS